MKTLVASALDDVLASGDKHRAAQSKSRDTLPLPTTKLLSLDAMRGLAAVVVAVGHFFLAFAPRIHGFQFVGKEDVGLVGTPLFALFNGTAAVVFFFVLSGFVLSIKALKKQSPAILVKSAVKRWPRLAGPVLLISLLSATLAATGLYANAQASELTGSEWFRAFDFHLPGNAPNVLDASIEGTVLTFFTGSAFYNPVLWTMFYEFVGSFFVFGLAFALLFARSGPLKTALLAAAWILTFYLSPFFSCFVVGVAIAVIYSEFGSLSFPSWLLPISLAMIFLIWGYAGPIGYYHSMGALVSDTAESRTAIYTIAAVLLMWLGLWCPSVKRLLSSAAGQQFGRLSFPIYLTHFPVMCSVGSRTYIYLALQLPSVVVLLATFIACSIATISLSVIVANFDKALTTRLDSLVSRQSCVDETSKYSR